MYDMKKVEWKITRAMVMLDCMKMAKEDFRSTNTYRQRYGARNFLVYNNSVTYVLQNLRSIVGEEKFEAWYSPYQVELKDDPIMNKIHKMRTETLKKGETHFGTHGQTIVCIIDSDNNDSRVKLEGDPILELWDLKELSGKSTIECMDHAINFFKEMLKDAEETFLTKNN